MAGLITKTVHLLAMSVSLWMAFYLFTRGFPNRIALRAVLALFAIAVFFLGTYNSFFHATAYADNLLASLILISLSCWFGVTRAFLPEEKRTQFRWMRTILYLLCSASIALLLLNAEVELRGGDALHAARLDLSPVSVVYGAAQTLTMFGVIFNLIQQERALATIEGRYYFAASVFLTAAFVYGAFAVFVNGAFPRVVEDVLVFGCIFTISLSVMRHQSFVERRTIWQDSFIALFGMFGIVIFYAALFLLFKLPQEALGNFIALVIITHSMYDLGREVVERWRKKEARHLKRSPLRMTSLQADALRLYLNQELGFLLSALRAESGTLAIREADKLIVFASQNSLELNTELPPLSAPATGLVRVDGAPCPTSFGRRKPTTVWKRLS
ncbi:MAG: hypothetical protein LC099_02370 [Anaerolineales bacterium]|nr:hypothetical protein [Anaerolineales bacterium]